ncbi:MULTISPECIES: hypothetical protein [Lachnospiraceae]|uniref:hypothetical protein n=1 Tax=Lachnospiraceae TaxID=186803 RepID=UPI0026320120|nr:hypothetical protein [Frisingicoccus sp.]MDD6233094.1 hypothetical protein [Frisingicoccus sp.]MDY5987326.1 hypothetical protein [Lachnoclostridium sp.]
MSKMIFGEEKSREEVMREIRKNPVVYSKFLDLKQIFQEQFVQFCMGVRGMKMTYDTFSSTYLMRRFIRNACQK